jgi:hypothetical protein
VPETPDVDTTVHRIETLLEELGEVDPQHRAQTEEVVGLLLQLYGAGLARAMKIAGSETAAQFGEDKLLGSLLLLHGLHPIDAATRVAEALHRLERRVDGARMHLDGIEDDVARIRVEWDGRLAVPTLATAIERAIAESAPDVSRVEIEGLPQPPTALVQIDALPLNMPAVSR